MSGMKWALAAGFLLVALLATLPLPPAIATPAGQVFKPVAKAKLAHDGVDLAGANLTGARLVGASGIPGAKVGPGTR
jgi:predicted lysophospholipase L1 biosynthesis ABC-type transport system permease subunit